MSDLISRHGVSAWLSNMGYDELADMVIDEKRFQSAEPKTGEWIKATGMMPPEFHGHHCCSECGAFANMDAPFGNREDLSDYCPNCGARMNGGE